jgi:threonine dehydrogenase-like Zn-dependent dehydrogenase
VTSPAAPGDDDQPRAAFLLAGAFHVRPLPPLRLGPRQLRVKPIAAGVCGTDLSAWAHPHDFLTSLERFGATHFLFDPNKPLVLGHEFSAEVIEVGEGVEDYAPGDRIFTMPVVTSSGAIKTVGYDNAYPGGLSEEVIVNDWGHIKLDPHVDSVLAALLDPVATGIEGVRRTGLHAGEVGAVIGVGPVGLGAIVELVARGASAIVASDLSERRRELALRYGATYAVDPAQQDPIALCRDLLPNGSRLRIVEASGAAGMLDVLMRSVPPFSIIAVMGANTRGETIFPMGATTANVTLAFASGPDFGETRYEALHRGYELLRDDAFDARAMVTAYTGLAGVAATFDALRPQSGATEHVKILIVPALHTDRLLTPDEFAATRSRGAKQ